MKAAGLHAAQVVFSEAFWIGTKEENPQEHKQPMPMAIIEAGRKAQGMLSLAPSSSLCLFVGSIAYSCAETIPICAGCRGR